MNMTPETLSDDLYERDRDDKITEYLQDQAIMTANSLEEIVSIATEANINLYKTVKNIDEIIRLLWR